MKLAIRQSIYLLITLLELHYASYHPAIRPAQGEDLIKALKDWLDIPAHQP